MEISKEETTCLTCFVVAHEVAGEEVVVAEDDWRIELIADPLQSNASLFRHLCFATVQKAHFLLSSS